MNKRLVKHFSIDVSNWERHLSPSFGSPSLEHFDGPPSLSFGTLNAVASYCLRILSKSSDATLQLERSRLSLVLEQSLSLLLSQALLYILDPRLASQVTDQWFQFSRITFLDCNAILIYLWSHWGSMGLIRIFFIFFKI